MNVNGVRIHRGLGKKKGKRFSSAPTKAEIRRLENQIERAEQQAIDLSLLEEARAIAAQDKMIAFAAQQQAAETTSAAFGTVAKTIPWVLGGLGALIAGAMLLKPKKRRAKHKKKRRGKRRVQTSARKRRRRR